jgi:hypothetical protein
MVQPYFTVHVATELNTKNLHELQTRIWIHKSSWEVEQERTSSSSSVMSSHGKTVFCVGRPIVSDGLHRQTSLLQLSLARKSCSVAEKMGSLITLYRIREENTFVFHVCLY